MSTSLPRPARVRSRRRAGTAAALLTLAGSAAACQIRTEIHSSCQIIGAISQSVTSNVTPDDVRPGGIVTNEITVSTPRISISTTFDRVTYRWPIPAAISSVEAVTFTGGNLDGSWQVIDHDLVLAFVADTERTDTFVIPTSTITARVSPSAPGGTMAWPAPRDFGVTVINPQLVEACTPAPGTPEINNSNIVGPPNPNWTPPGSIGSPASATTMPVPVTTTTAPPPPPPPPPRTSSTIKIEPDLRAPTLDTDATLACAILGSLPIRLGAVHEPATPVAGGPLDLAVALNLGNIPLSLNVASVAVTFPMPPEINSVSAVELTGGNFVGSATLADRNVVVTFTPNGAVTTDAMAFPTVRIHAHLGEDTAGKTIVVPGPSKLTADVGIAVERCEAAAGNPPLETITVKA